MQSNSAVDIPLEMHLNPTTDILSEMHRNSAVFAASGSVFGVFASSIFGPSVFMGRHVAAVRLREQHGPLREGRVSSGGRSGDWPAGASTCLCSRSRDNAGDALHDAERARRIRRRL